MIAHRFVPNPWPRRDECDAKVSDDDRNVRQCGFPAWAHGVRFYVASRIENAEAVKRLAALLTKAGHIHTYDWTAHGAAFKAAATPEQNVTAMRAVADAEVEGVTSADVVIVLLPGGRGTHVELGAAIAAEKPILLCAEFPDRLTGEQSGEFPWPCAFHYHRLVHHVLFPNEESRFEVVLITLNEMRERRRAG